MKGWNELSPSRAAELTYAAWVERREKEWPILRDRVLAIINTEVSRAHFQVYINVYQIMADLGFMDELIERLRQELSDAGFKLVNDSYMPDPCRFTLSWVPAGGVKKP